MNSQTNQYLRLETTMTIFERLRVPSALKVSHIISSAELALPVTVLVSRYTLSDDRQAPFGAVSSAYRSLDN